MFNEMMCFEPLFRAGKAPVVSGMVGWYGGLANQTFCNPVR